MSALRSDSPNVLLLDFWSDKNRGDAAMQIALVQLVRKRLPESRLTIMAAHGANQWPGFIRELDQTAPLVDEVVGGIRPTFIPFGSRLLSVRLVRKAANAIATLVGICLLPVWPFIALAPWLDVLFPRSVRRAIRSLRTADLVLWNGRNFRADSARREPYEIWNLLYNPVVALLFGKPVACIGASIWPLQHPLSRFLTRLVIGKTFFTSLRERGSYEYANSLLHDKNIKLELFPDLSLSVLARDSDDARLTRPLSPELRRLGLTVVDWRGSGEAARSRYLQALSGFLARFLERDGAEVVLIPQVTYEMEATESLEQALLRRLRPERVRVILGHPSVEELASLYRGIDLLVATRMHSAIFALCEGTPVVTIPYDEGGKWGILDMMGAHNLDVPFRRISAESLERKIESVWARRCELLASVRNSLPQLAKMAEEGVNIPISAYLDEAALAHDRSGTAHA